MRVPGRTVRRRCRGLMSYDVAESVTRAEGDPVLADAPYLAGPSDTPLHGETSLPWGLPHRACGRDLRVRTRIVKMTVLFS